MRKLIILMSISLFQHSSSLFAEQSTEQCGFSNDDFLSITSNPEESPIDVKADRAQFVDGGTSIFTGDVEVVRSGQELKSDRATYNKLSGQVTAQGNVQIRDSAMILNSKRAEWSLTNDSGLMTDAKYRLKESHARGSAAKVNRQGKLQTKLDSATYTTCAEGDNAWLLHASKVNLDHVAAIGSARNVVVRVGDVPVFYTPYISFALNDERKSGFLVPSIGSTSKTGFDLRAPYYWNIAPEMDATITPRYMSDRGIMVNGEFRYLTKGYRGNIDAAFLASDDLEDDGDNVNPYYGEDRKHFSWQHNSQLASRLYTNIDYNYVSDNNYLEDFGSGLSLVSTTHINRQVRMAYHADSWNLTGGLKGYQTLTDAVKPYQRLPEIRFQSQLPEQFGGMTYALNAEYVDFAHDTKVAGQRFDIEPVISLPLRSSAAFITPRIALRHSRYELDANSNTIADSRLSRTLPISSIDSGLFFEKELTVANTNFIQTLEPRAFYLYIPERNQDDIPLFDTGLNTFSMGQLFSHNRFSGSDRIGDTNQLSLAITTRFIDKQTGREKFHATLGQIQYYSNRNVTLNSSAAETQSDSDMVAEVVAAITDEWMARGQMQWDPHGDTTNMSAASVAYRGNNGGLLNFSHRYRRDDLEQVDISAKIPINRQWNVIGRWYHSLKDSRRLEAMAGVEYDSCCWATRLVVRDYINSSTDQESNLAIFFQIELKGLGNFGQDTDSLLQKSILGYGS